jgi:hypothetical protein
MLFRVRCSRKGASQPSRCAGVYATVETLAANRLVTSFVNPNNA